MTARHQYHEFAEDVLVVATWGEAALRGARVVKGVHRLGGRRVLSAAAGPRAIEGLRVANVDWTPAAVEHPNYEQMQDTLLRSQIKSRIS